MGSSIRNVVAFFTDRYDVFVPAAGDFIEGNIGVSSSGGGRCSKGGTGRASDLAVFGNSSDTRDGAGRASGGGPGRSARVVISRGGA